MNARAPGLLDRAIAGVCRAVLWLSTAVIFMILVINTLLRYIIGTSLQWANEVPELLFPWLVMAGVVIAAQHGAHIATTFLMDAVNASIRRIVTTVAWLVVAVMYGTLSVATFRMLEIVHAERTPILQLPGSITYACVMTGMGMLGLLAVQSAWQAWRSPLVAPQSTEQPVPAAHW